MRNRALTWWVLALSFLPFTSDAQERVPDPERTIQVRIKAKGKRKRGVVRYIPSLRVDVGIDPVGAVGLTVLATGTTDEDGGAVVDLPYSLLERRSDSEDLRVWASVKSPGYQQRTAAVAVADIDPDTGTLPTLLVPALEGGTIRGVLLDRDGRAIAGTVLGYRLDSGNAWRQAGSAGAQPRTGFSFHLKDEGSWHLAAEATKPSQRVSRVLGTDVTGTIRPWDERMAGTAKSDVFEYQRGDSPRDVVLRLVGPGGVRGRVVDTEGVPAAGLGLEILIARAGEDFGAHDEQGMLDMTAYAKQSSAFRSEAGGHYLRNVTTDADGRFVCEGLRDEPYVIRTRSTSPYRWPCDVPTDPSPRMLQLREGNRPHLVVFVRKPSGGPASDLVLFDGGNAFGFADAWSEIPTLMVVRRPDIAKGSQVSDVILRGSLIEDGVASFYLGGVGDYDIVLMAPGAALITRRLQVTEGSGRIDMVIDPAPAVDQGELTVCVLNPDGVDVAKLVSVRVVDPVTGTPLLERRNFYSRSGRQQWPTRFALPSGDYRLEVNSIPFVEFHHGTLSTPRRFGGYARMVHVGSGQRTEVEAVLGKPAFLLLRLEGEADEADLDAVKNRFVWPHETREQYARRAATLLRPDSGYPIQVEFARYSGQGTSAAGTHLTSRLELGSEAKSEALPSGNYRLEARLPGGRVVTKDVALVAGETVSVDLSFPSGN